MAKRALDLPVGRYLNFICAMEDGWLSMMRVDLNTVRDPEVVEALFDDVMVTQRKSGTSQQYQAADALMSYVGRYIARRMTPTSAASAASAKKRLEVLGVTLPSGWSPEDWGTWEIFGSSDILFSEGKHYYYDFAQ